MSIVRTLIGNIKGPKGDTGATGATGPTGAAGTNGTDGAAATINVGTVTTSAYGTTAQVTNSGTESAAVFDFVIPQGRPGEETTRMSALTLDQVTASTASQPVPAVGESGSVVWGKVIKFFNDVKSALTNKINYSDCVTNLTSTSGTLPLAASQGKALNDAKASKTELQAVVDSIASVISMAKTSDSAPITFARSSCAIVGNKIVLVDVAFSVTGTIASNVLQSMFYFPNRTFARATDLQCTRIFSGGSTTNNVIIPFFADSATHRIGVNGGSTSQMINGTSWNLTGIVVLN